MSSQTDPVFEEKSLTFLIKDLLKNLFRSSGFITFIVVIAAYGAAYLFVRYTSEPASHSWSAYYCHPSGCQVGNSAEAGNLYLDGDQSPACPETMPVKTGVVLVGIVPVSVNTNFLLEPNTCEIKEVDK